MNDDLLEISGIVYVRGSQDHILAINDEEGKVFSLQTKADDYAEVKFSGRGDYEDITVYRQSIFILESNGTIYSLPKTVTENEMPGKKWEGLLPKGEYESLFADSVSNRLYVLCKDCDDTSGNIIQGYSFELGGDSIINNRRSFALRQDSLKLWSKKKFLPSCLARNGLSGDWYVVSSANKLLLVTDSTWRNKKIIALDPAMFRQPEGITFDRAGNLYISNEGDELHNGNILLFEKKP